MEVEALRRNGTFIQVEVSMTALSRSDGYVLNAFFRDLTDKTIAEQQLRQAQKMVFVIGSRPAASPTTSTTC